MPTAVLENAALTAAVGSAWYAAAAAVTAVAAPTPDRRRDDARGALEVLVRRNPR
ncbi:hypothetical protein Kpho02_36960 [Kitasatospora phosalacinea]|uniref:Uncharacterized protein n=1 Tax=Kitasatospora phosalacinea TaxID=2065 RepID=A0A9W6QB77_9ACTN|nr:hypothetical protein [Kitasatospora phosalacinea]GLW71397.1 hypothetical protein Kpho02_36960 [Kitasatospora phosalacinea]